MTNQPILPTDLTEQKRFRRILDILSESVMDDIDDLAFHLLAESDAPAPPDPNENEAYDRWCDEVLTPMEDRIWDLIKNTL